MCKGWSKCYFYPVKSKLVMQRYIFNSLHSSLHLIENSGRNFDDVLKNLYL